MYDMDQIKPYSPQLYRRRHSLYDRMLSFSFIKTPNPPEIYEAY